VTRGTQVRTQSFGEGREGDARAQARNAALGRLGEESEESKAGDRDRAVGGAPRRRQGAEPWIAQPVALVGRTLAVEALQQLVEPIARPVEPFVEPLLESFAEPVVESQPLAFPLVQPQPEQLEEVLVRAEAALQLEPVGATRATDAGGPWHMDCLPSVTRFCGRLEPFPPTMAHQLRTRPFGGGGPLSERAITRGILFAASRG